MKRVDVYYEGWGEKWKLGALAHHERIVMFEYSNEALSQQLELSPLFLPLQKPGFSDFPRHQHQLPGLIADSLPDGWGMLVMDRLLKKSGVPLGPSCSTGLASHGCIDVLSRQQLVGSKPR